MSLTPIAASPMSSANELRKRGASEKRSYVIIAAPSGSELGHSMFSLPEHSIPMGSCDNCGRRHCSDIPEVFIRADGFYLEPKHVTDLISTGAHVGPGITRILDDLVVKYSASVRVAEAENSEFVRKNTNIPVPKVHLVFCLEGQISIVFQFIKGIPLRDYWGKAGDKERSNITRTTASYISQLRTLEAPPRPGPVNPLAAWRGRWFTDYDLEPLPSHRALVDWLNHKRDVCERFRKLPNNTSPFTTDYDLVFTHGDIAPRNFIIDDREVLWLVDWDTAGWYPAYMEYATIAVERDDIHNPVIGIEDWIKSITAAIDCYDEERRMLGSIWWALHSAPFVE